jgi:hypothetical protein
VEYKYALLLVPKTPSFRNDNVFLICLLRSA